MTIYRVVIALLLLTILSCDSKEQYVQETDVPIDSLLLNNFHPETIVNYYPLDSALIISYVSNDGKYILFYNATDGLLCDSMSFNVRDFDDEYYADLNKNLYLHYVTDNKLVIKDSTGNQSSYTIGEEFVSKSWDTFRTTYSGICPTLEVVDSTIIMNVMHGFHLADSRERPLYYSTENLACLRITDDTMVKLSEFAKFPTFYQEHFINEPWPLSTRSGNQVYYLFSNDNILYRYNIISDATDSFHVEGLNKNERVEYNMDRIGDISYTSEYEVQISSYVKLLHDRKRNNFMVFQMLPVKEKQHNGMLLLYEDKPVLLNLIDSSMNVYSKIHFQNHVKFGMRYIYYYDGKLYLPERSSHNHNKNSLKIYVYDVSSL